MLIKELFFSLFVFRRGNSYHFLEALAEIFRIVEPRHICYLGEVIFVAVNQLYGTFDTYFPYKVNRCQSDD